MKIEPCYQQGCGGECGVENSGPDEHWAYCLKCFYRSKKFFTAAEAVESHNLISRTLSSTVVQAWMQGQNKTTTRWSDSTYIGESQAADAGIFRLVVGDTSFTIELLDYLDHILKGSGYQNMEQAKAACCRAFESMLARAIKALGGTVAWRHKDDA